MALSTTASFTPIYPVRERGPVCFLLRLGDYTILLDCGWTGAFDEATLEPLRAVAPSINAVLISHPDIAHIGALPYLVNKMGLPSNTPIYTTGAVHKMGQMFMYDAYLTRHAVSEFSAFDLDDVDAAFSRVISVRYRQEVMLTGAGITLTALPAGHLLGGAIWRIARGGEEHVYAIDFNHRRERHLIGTTLEATFSRPALLMAGSGGSRHAGGDGTAAEKQLIDIIMNTLRMDGNVLIPVDAAGRVLELILLLEKHWSDLRLTYPLVFLCPMVHTTMEFARSQLEWMNESLAKSFGHTRDNPYNVRFLKPCTSKAELAKLPPGPKLVMATAPSLEAGPARELFAEWAADYRNTVLFITEPEQGSLGEGMMQLAADRDARPYGTQLPFISVPLSRRVPLEGEELAVYLTEQEEQRRLEAERAEAEQLQRMDVDGGGSPRSVAAYGDAAAQPTRASSSAIGHLKSGAAGRTVVVGADGLPLEDASQPVDECLIEGFDASEGTVAPMFPAEDEWEAVVYDEYGAALDLADTDPDAANRATLQEELEAEQVKEDEDDKATAAADVPTKVVGEVATMELRCRVAAVDMSGVSDARSVRMLLARVAPRNCIVIRGSPEETAVITKYVEQELEGLYAAVHVPAAGDSIELEEGGSFEVALDEAVGAAADMHAVGEYQMAWIDGVMGSPKEEGDLPLLQRSHQGGSSGQQGGVFIGDVRLSDLRKALSNAGIASEFHGGDLYCAGHVIVKRSQSEGGGLVLEGVLGEGYFRVREVVYGQYHIA